MGIPIVLTSALLAIAAVGPALAQDNSADPEETGPPAAANEPLKAMPSYRSPALPWRSYEDARAAETICRDRIHKAREQMGQPALDRESASDDEPMAIWAVDRREDGCAVLVTMGNPDDIRPIPKIEEKHLLRPAG